MKKLFVVGILLLQALFLFPQSSKPVVINEVMSSNVSSVLDDNQNFTEYIELYNPTNTIYYFNGIYLSNDRNNLLKYKIIDGFSIASKKYVVGWCDKRIRSLHANFKLDPDGGTIYLSNSSMQILRCV